MKKFLIFLVSIVVVVCLGLTTFYFMKNDEVITINTKEIYCNAGDTISLESLGITRKKANKKTTFNYNAGGEKVKSAISFDDKKGYYVVNGEVAGDITLVITTSNKKYAEFTIQVHIGNGEAETPYYVFSESDLIKIGSVYGLGDHYQLMNDITLTSDFKPIGYSEAESIWSGFSGSFNGNGHTIKAMTLVGEYPNAGFFSSINSTATVSNLILDKATISGSYSKAGVLAGEISGSVNRVGVTNSVITNTASDSYTGSLTGMHNASNLKMAYADGVTINLGTDVAVNNAVVGGLVGKVNQSTLQATYANNVTINLVAESSAKVGGFAGVFVIGTNAGSIQQSYANTNSDFNNFGAFIGEIEKTADFAATKNDSIKYLIGNAVVTNGKDIVKTYDNTIFEYFLNESNASYLIVGYETSGNLIVASESLVYYAIAPQQKTLWDTDYVWQTANSYLPKLRMGNVEPVSPSGEYFRKDLSDNLISEAGSSFEDIFNADQVDKKFKLLEDVTIDSWTPVALTNCTLDGNGKTVTVNLNNASGDFVGLFSKIDNCTIKNLNIVVTNLTASATNVGGLAGEITSTDNVATSTIENVNITFNSVGSITATNFGGLAGKVENATISSCSVKNLNVNANIANVGGMVGLVDNQDVTIDNCSVEATVYATNKVGGVAAENNGRISNVNVNAHINYNSNEDNATVGGVAGYNKGTITKVNATIKIAVNSANNTLFVGGVAGINAKEITNTKLVGEGISIANIAGSIYVGGIVAENAGKIDTVQNNLVEVGTYNISRNVKTGGVACKNSGNISKATVSSDLYGNYVAGVVVEQNTASAVVDQVLVGGSNANEIKGDKYVAGIVVDFRLGNITNIQATSNIVGAANSTRSSLVALIFPYGANLKNATISSSISGYGSFYRETWTDFASYTNKAEFGYENTSSVDGRFDVYTNDTQHGSMQSVVIDSSKQGVSNAKAAMAAAFAFSKDYTDSDESSYIKVVNGFNDISQFQGAFEFTCAISEWLGIEHKVIRTLTFDVGTIWQDNGSGISLIFLSSLN